jgi:hypothetical protein
MTDTPTPLTDDEAAAAALLTSEPSEAVTIDTDPALADIDPELRAWLDQNVPVATGEAAEPAPTPATADEADALPTSDTSSDEGSPTGLPTPEPGAPAEDDELPVAASLRIDYGGQPLDITPDIAAELVALHQWHNHPDRQQLFAVTAAIEAGEAVALSRQDYDTLLAAAKAPAAAPAPTPAKPQIDPNRFLDPEMAQLFAQQQAELEALKASLAPVDAPLPDARPLYQPVDPVAAAAAAEANRNLQIVQQVSSSYAERYGLTPQELASLEAAAAQSGDVARLVDQHHRTSPHLPLDLERIFAAAYDRAIVTNPSLRARYEATLRSAPTTPATAPVAPTPSATDDALDAKRRRASSLASIPSAATPAVNRDPRAMSDRDMQEAIAAELRAALA